MLLINMSSGKEIMFPNSINGKQTRLLCFSWSDLGLQRDLTHNVGWCLGKNRLPTAALV